MSAKVYVHCKQIIIYSLSAKINYKKFFFLMHFTNIFSAYTGVLVEAVLVLQQEHLLHPKYCK